MHHAMLQVNAQQDNVAGVKLPKFERANKEASGSSEGKMGLTGLGSGGKQIQTCRQSFLTTVDLLIELASLQTAFLTLDEEIKKTNRRVNALDNVVRPRLENTISYIKVLSCTEASFMACCNGPCLHQILLHSCIIRWQMLSRSKQ